ncbi:MAG: metal ABC transporter ATP-binding protein [Chloroflexota bacterium]
MKNWLKHPTYIWKTAHHKDDAPILSIENLSVKYDTGMVLNNLSFDLLAKDRIAVVGPNGAGKSTLFKVIAGVLRPSSGSVQIYGHEPGGHICISYIPQRTQVDWGFPVTVADVVMMGRISKLGLFRWPKAEDWELSHHALEVVGLADLAKRQISELSGGQQQRMFIARALVQEAELMLMDEPLTGLDQPSKESIFAILDQLHQQGVALLVSMHDLKLAAEHFDRIMLLKGDIIAFGPPEEVLAPDVLSKAYGGHLHLITEDGRTLAVNDSCCEGDHYALD